MAGVSRCHHQALTGPLRPSAIFSPQDSENSGDSGYPSEKRGELDDPEPRERVRNSWEINMTSFLFPRCLGG